MSTLSGKIETFVALASINSQDLANRISAALEESGIPIVLEHIALKDDSSKQLENGFRLSTQEQFFESAMRIVNNHLTVHNTKKLVTLREQAS